MYVCMYVQLTYKDRPDTKTIFQGDYCLLVDTPCMCQLSLDAPAGYNEWCTGIGCVKAAAMTPGALAVLVYLRCFRFLATAHAHVRCGFLEKSWEAWGQGAGAAQATINTDAVYGGSNGASNRGPPTDKNHTTQVISTKTSTPYTTCQPTSRCNQTNHHTQTKHHPQLKVKMSRSYPRYKVWHDKYDSHGTAWHGMA